MKLKGKLLLVAIVPLVVSLGLTAVVLRRQQHELEHRQQELVRGTYTAETEAALRHYMALALSTISPLYNTGRDDEEVKHEAMRRLALLDYGPDGYFFLYDFDGRNLMHPRQPELVGKNLIETRDANGQPVIQVMIDKARAGGGMVTYTWNKPSARAVAPKLAYVTGLSRWRWMIGTGVYLDDLDKVMGQLDREIEASVDTTVRWIALSAAASIVIILLGMLGLGLNELRAADAKLTLLTRKVVRSQEEERAWLSRELHDGTGQTLVSVKLLTESALDRLPPSEERVRPMLHRALMRVNDALNDVRGFSHHLRPAELDSLGLCTALRELGEEMCAPAGTRFELQGCPDLPELPDEIRTTLFRVSQEALTNARKHAIASQVRIELQREGDGLCLSIEDDGRGFDSAAVAQDPRRGIGLRNMRERLESIGATLEVRSGAQGTRVAAHVAGESIRRFERKRA